MLEHGLEGNFMNNGGILREMSPQLLHDQRGKFFRRFFAQVHIVDCLSQTRKGGIIEAGWQNIFLLGLDSTLERASTFMRRPDFLGV